jgi:hypothetical protein
MDACSSLPAPLQRLLVFFQGPHEGNNDIGAGGIDGAGKIAVRQLVNDFHRLVKARLHGFVSEKHHLYDPGCITKEMN